MFVISRNLRIVENDVHQRMGKRRPLKHLIFQGSRMSTGLVCIVSPCILNYRLFRLFFGYINFAMYLDMSYVIKVKYQKDV
jgi:hypothetical protein